MSEAVVPARAPGPQGMNLDLAVEAGRPSQPGGPNPPRQTRSKSPLAADAREAPSVLGIEMRSWQRQSHGTELMRARRVSMVWALEVYRILAYRRMAELLAEAQWAGTVAQANPWRPAKNTTSRAQDERRRIGTGRPQPRIAADFFN